MGNEEVLIAVDPHKGHNTLVVLDPVGRRPVAGVLPGPPSRISNIACAARHTADTVWQQCNLPPVSDPFDA